MIYRSRSFYNFTTGLKKFENHHVIEKNNHNNNLMCIHLARCSVLQLPLSVIIRVTRFSLNHYLYKVTTVVSQKTQSDWLEYSPSIP